MTTGRINQVATSRFEAGSTRRRTSTKFAMCVEFRLRPCISFAIVLYHGSAPASAPLSRGAAGKAGSAASALRDSISARNTAELRYQMRLTKICMNGWKKQPLIHTTPNKSTGHPESDWLALGVKAKKEKRTRRLANQAFAWCHPEAEDRNRRGCMKQRKET